MSFDANAVLGLGYGSLIIAFLLGAFCLWKADEYLCTVASGVLAGGLMLWAAALIWRALDRAMSVSQEASSGPAAFSLLLFFPLTCGAIALMMERKYRIQAITPFIALIVLGAGGCALFVPWAGASLPPSIDGWFVAYRLGIVFSYSLFLTAGAAGVFELLRPALAHKIQAYESSSEALVEGLASQAIRWGLVFLSTALIVGAVRSWLLSGNYWSWNLVELSTLVIWAIYGAYLHLRRFRSWSIAAALGIVLVAASLVTL